MGKAKPIACFAVLVALAALSPQARANDVPAAQGLFDHGKHLMAQGKYAEACSKFEESERLDPALGTLLNLADCNEKEGKIATAWTRFLELVAEADLAGQAARAQIGRARAAALAPRLPRIVVVAPQSGAPNVAITRDGVAVGEGKLGTDIPADPWPHVVAATSPGKQSWSTTVTLSEGKTTTVDVPDLAALPPGALPVMPAPAPLERPPAAELPSEPPPVAHRGGLGTQKVVALVALGLGVAAVGVGTAFGLVSSSKHSQASSACPGPTCPTDAGSALWHDAVVTGNVATAAFIAGGVAVAAGAVLWFTAKDHPSAAPAPVGGGAPSVAVGLGLGDLRVRATW